VEGVLVLLHVVGDQKWKFVACKCNSFICPKPGRSNLSILPYISQNLELIIRMFVQSSIRIQILILLFQQFRLIISIF